MVMTVEEKEALRSIIFELQERLARLEKRLDELEDRLNKVLPNIEACLADMGYI